MAIGEVREGMTAMFSRANLSNDMLITSGFYPRAIKGKFAEAEGWSNLPDKEIEPLEMEAKMVFRDAEVATAETSWYVLAGQSGDNGYDRASLSPSKDLNHAFCTLSVGEWSPVINTRIKMQDGKMEEAFFRCKLIELSDDAEDFRLYISSVGAKTGWSNPAEIAAELQSQEGVTGIAGGIMGYALEWYDLNTFVEINEYYTQFLADCACALLGKHEWDLFFMHAHSPDYAYHMILTEVNPSIGMTQARKEAK